MIWKAKPSPPKPKAGDLKYENHFAWFPVRVTDVSGKAYMIWLELYQMVYEYIYRDRWIMTAFVKLPGWDLKYKRLPENKRLGNLPDFEFIPPPPNQK